MYQGVRCSGGKWKEGLAEEIGITQSPFETLQRNMFGILELSTRLKTLGLNYPARPHLFLRSSKVAFAHV